MATPPTALQRPRLAEIVSSPLTKTNLAPPSAQETTPTPPPGLNDPPVSVNSFPLPQNTIPPSSDRTVSSTQNLCLALPPSISTGQHTASSTSSLPVPFHNDHDYTPSQPSSAPKQPNPKCCKSDSAPNKPPKAPFRGRKRGRGEEQQSVTSSQDDQCVGGTGDAVGGTVTGVIQEGKRIRKPSQRAKALQEATQAKVRSVSVLLVLDTWTL